MLSSLSRVRKLLVLASLRRISVSVCCTSRWLMTWTVGSVGAGVVMIFLAQKRVVAWRQAVIVAPVIRPWRLALSGNRKQEVAPCCAMRIGSDMSFSKVQWTTGLEPIDRKSVV